MAGWDSVDVCDSCYHQGPCRWLWSVLHSEPMLMSIGCVSTIGHNEVRGLPAVICGHGNIQVLVAAEGRVWILLQPESVYVDVCDLICH